jgi:hypothetical protein
VYGDNVETIGARPGALAKREEGRDHAAGIG